MPITIQPYREEHEPAVKELNQRLKAAGQPDVVFYPSCVPHWLPKSDGNFPYNEYFVAIDGTAVRGAYALKHERIFVRGKGMHSIACYHHPLSEGIINRSYATVGGLLLRDALSRQPMLYTLGMGGFDRPLPKMLGALGWKLLALPFYFRVVHPNRFLREMEALRQVSWRKLLIDIGALTGTGWLAIKALQSASRLRSQHTEPFTVEKVDEFSAWADPLWSDAMNGYTMCAVRDSGTLQKLYPDNDPHLTRLRISQDGTAIGWAVVGERRRDVKFGSMRVGSIVDCWASPENALPVVLAATQALEAAGVDLIVSNQSHSLWCSAFGKSGYLKGPSNFILAVSKKESELLQPFEENQSSFHIVRADGDGLPRNF